MFISKLMVKNWRNFRKVEVDFQDITYILGPNASGKSNFLDIFRFLRDIVTPQGGGLQQAFNTRGGFSKVRCLAARRDPRIEVAIDIAENLGGAPKWRYELELEQSPRGKRQVLVAREVVFSYSENEEVLCRPTPEDKMDRERLTQTALEQIAANGKFREIATFLADVLYLHLVPQLLRFGNLLAVKKLDNDPFGQGFLESIATTSEKNRASRLERIEKILKTVIHDLRDLEFTRDQSGQPHLRMRYSHWRPNGGWQQEDEFSDGTLRLIGLLWTLLESNSIILLEEPELSLHKKIIEQIPALIQLTKQSRKKSGGQIFISTHSEAMLGAETIYGDYLILTPSQEGEGTEVRKPSREDCLAMASGLSPAEILLPQTADTIGNIGEL